MSVVISVSHLSKLYRLGSIGAGTLRGDFERWWARIRGRPDPLVPVDHEGPSAGFRNSKSDMRNGEIWALSDVSFEVRQGEILGIIGCNGAGKSTLLKILSRITAPTTGQVKIKGRVGSLLEVGTGFHPELTGRENIYLNGVILGMKKADIDRKLDEIVDFSGVERFIDTPVKRYSSGMYVRLAFAVAAHLEPEILIIDEVLAVGDAAFQKKCLGKMGAVAGEGRTVLFVSHNMGALQGLCGRAIWIDAGGIRADGDAQEVVARYLEDSSQGFTFSRANVPTSGELMIEGVTFRNGANEPTTAFNFGGEIRIELHYRARRRIDRPYFWIGIASQFGSVFGANMLLDGIRPSYIEGSGTVACRFPALWLLPQLYTVSIGVRGADGMSILVRSMDAGCFHITGAARDLGLDGEVADGLVASSSPMIVPYEWHLPDGRTVAVNFTAKAR
jgi:lipopolysaccharide transport system ATP-binding protein